MKGPSLQATTALSAALHLTFFLVAALILRHSRNVTMPSPYEVSLVGPLSSSQGAATEEIPEQAEPATRIVESIRQVEKPLKDTKTDLKRLEDRMAEIASKKKVERMVRLRSIVSINNNDSRGTQKTAAQGKGGRQSQGTLFDSYYGKITSQIRQEWLYPDTEEKNLEAIIAVTIARDGTVSVQKIEKSSGNALFDRSAMRALAKASPVAPPPYEMEIGMRFYP
jgi:colicin import membrane protein